jgi:hypothetical protein
VIVVEDENGNIVRETMKDNDVLAQYRCVWGRLGSGGAGGG